MSLQSYKKQQLLLDISTIKEELQQNIATLDQINNRIQKETEIISYENKYCNQCKEPCGRSNAEIFNCMKKKMTKTDTNNQKRSTQYTKEYLEKDLQEIMVNLQEKEKKLTEILEKIEKGFLHP